MTVFDRKLSLIEYPIKRFSHKLKVFTAKNDKVRGNGNHIL